MRAVDTTPTFPLMQHGKKMSPPLNDNLGAHPFVTCPYAVLDRMTYSLLVKSLLDALVQKMSITGIAKKPYKVIRTAGEKDCSPECAQRHCHPVADVFQCVLDFSR